MDKQYAREIGLGRYFWRTLRYKFLTVGLRRDARITLPTGASMHLPRDRAHAAEIYGTNCLVDWGAEDLLVEYLQSSGDREQRQFYDVGANIGFYSLLVAPVVGAVHAFEPDPRNLGPLRANTAGAAEIQVVDRAVAADCETRCFDVSGGHETNHFAHPGGPAAGPGLLRVETVTLDAYRAAHPGPRVAAVKMDIEGYECEALDGAHALTDQERPVFLIEFFEGPPYVNTLERLGAFLTRHGYQIFAVARDPDYARTRQTELRRLTLADVSHTRRKMLFLVPAEEEFFARRVGTLTLTRQ